MNWIWGADQQQQGRQKPAARLATRSLFATGALFLIFLVSLLIDSRAAFIDRAGWLLKTGVFRATLYTFVPRFARASGTK